MKRLITKGYKPEPKLAPDAPAPEAKTRHERNAIPTSSGISGMDISQYDSIFLYCRLHGGNDVQRMHDGTEVILMTPDQERHFGIHKDPFRQRCYALRESRYIYTPDNEEMVWSWTVQTNRDVILWEPRMDQPPEFDAIGGKVITSALRPARNATLTPAGQRTIYRPLLGVMYVGGPYR